MMNIILCHGILGFSHIDLGPIPPINYFRDIATRFAGRGHKVIAPQVDPTEGVIFRGRQLRQQIIGAFDKGGLDPNNEGALDPKLKTHIIAHSMGGLDSRYILSPKSPDHLGLPIRSLTTISTPHLGSPVADLLDPEHQGDSGGLAAAARVALKNFNVSLNGLHDLTTTECKKFNQQFTNDSTVEYFSVAGSGRVDTVAGGEKIGDFINEIRKTSGPLAPFHAYIVSKTDRGVANDGMVSVVSANFGTFDSDLWPGDHVEEVGYDLNNLLVPPGFYLAKYDQILAKLERL